MHVTPHKVGAQGNCAICPALSPALFSLIGLSPCLVSSCLIISSFLFKFINTLHFVAQSEEDRRKVWEVD